MSSKDKNSLSALSITSCFNLIKSYFTSQDNNSAYKELTKSNEGVFLIRILATVLSNLSYRIVSYMREIYISTANLWSSVTGISVNLGYSVYRGSNQRRLIRVNPTQTVVIPKYSILGSYNEDYSIINIENLVLKENQPVEITTVIGNVKRVQQKAGTNELKTFVFYTENISEDCILLKDDVEVPFSKIVRDMAGDKYLLRTNPFGSVDIQYLNDVNGAQYTYDSETVFTIKYIELADVPSIDYKDSMFSYFTLLNTSVIEKYIEPETVDKIKISAPYNHEVQNIIRAREDFRKRLPQINTKIIESDFTDINSVYAAVSYIKNDLSLLTNSEISSINSVLTKERSLGIPLPDITNPKRELITLNINIKPLGELVTLSDVDTDIKNILKSNYINKINKTLNIYDLEKLIEELSYVKYARVSIDELNRQVDTYYNIGDVIDLNNINYKATQILGKTGNNEPSWNIPVENSVEIDTGLETVDNGVIWKTYKKLDIVGLVEWSSDTCKKIGDYVYSTSYPNYMFKVVDLVKTNDLALSAAPEGFSSGNVGDFVNDGDIVWVRKILNSSHATRTGNTSYRLGDNVKVGNYSYECIGYRGKTSASNSSIPVFELKEYTVDSQGSNYFDISGDYTEFFKEDDVLKVFVSNSSYYSFSVDSVSYLNSTGKTRVNVQQVVNPLLTFQKIQKVGVGTIDGEIYWTILDDISNYVTDWKTYNDVTYSLSLL